MIKGIDNMDGISTEDTVLHYLVSMGLETVGQLEQKEMELLINKVVVEHIVGLGIADHKTRKFLANFEMALMTVRTGLQRLGVKRTKADNKRSFDRAWEIGVEKFTQTYGVVETDGGPLMRQGPSSPKRQREVSFSSELFGSEQTYNEDEELQRVLKASKIEIMMGNGMSEADAAAVLAVEEEDMPKGQEAFLKDSASTLKMITPHIGTDSESWKRNNIDRWQREQARRVEKHKKRKLAKQQKRATIDLQVQPEKETLESLQNLSDMGESLPKDVDDANFVSHENLPGVDVPSHMTSVEHIEHVESTETAGEMDTDGEGDSLFGD